MAYELGRTIVNIKKYKNHDPFTAFRVAGMGDLKMLGKANGWGYCLETLGHTIYISSDETDEHFVDYDYWWDNMENIIRESKIDQIVG